MGKHKKGEEIEKISVRLDLTGELMERFLKLKEWTGATTNKGLCHMLITQKYGEMLKEEEKKGRE